MGIVRYGLALVCLASTSALWACAAGPSSGPEGEDIGQAESAFGESACGTETNNLTIVSKNILKCGDSDREVSPSTYTSNGCPEGFKVEYTGSIASNNVVGAQWTGSTPTDQATCTSSWVLLDVYNSSGSPVNSVISQGVWNSDPFLGGCVLFASGGPLPGTGGRVVASAGSNPAGVNPCSGKSCSLATQHSVTVNMTYNPGGC